MSIPLNTYSGILATDDGKITITLSYEGFNGTIGDDLTWYAITNKKPDVAPTIELKTLETGATKVYTMIRNTDTEWKLDWTSYYSEPQLDIEQTLTAIVTAKYMGKSFQSNTVELSGN